jgi:hypothetical protein
VTQHVWLSRAGVEACVEACLTGWHQTGLKHVAAIYDKWLQCASAASSFCISVTQGVLLTQQAHIAWHVTCHNTVLPGGNSACVVGKLVGCCVWSILLPCEPCSKFGGVRAPTYAHCTSGDNHGLQICSRCVLLYPRAPIAALQVVKQCCGAQFFQCTIAMFRNLEAH